MSSARHAVDGESPLRSVVDWAGRGALPSNADGQQIQRGRKCDVHCQSRDPKNPRAHIGCSFFSLDLLTRSTSSLKSQDHLEPKLGRARLSGQGLRPGTGCAQVTRRVNRSPAKFLRRSPPWHVLSSLSYNGEFAREPSWSLARGYSLQNIISVRCPQDSAATHAVVNTVTALRLTSDH